MKIQLFNADCLVHLPKIKEKVDLVVVDLPYAQTACAWDSLIDMKQMWIELKKICKRDCVYVFFCTTKFGYKLIQSNEKWFRYDLIWEKSRKVGFLSANKMPLRKHEMMYVFADASTNDLEYNRNLGLRVYAEKVKNYINTPIKEIDKAVGNQGMHHFYSFKSTQFGLPTEKTYNVLIDKYNLQDMSDFREYKSLKDEWTKPETTYNPQKTEGKSYKAPKVIYDGKMYNNGKPYNKTEIDNKGDRHPSSILNFPEVPEEQEPREHEMMYVFKEKGGTYNPQKTKGKPYKTKGEGNIAYYGSWSNKRIPSDNKGDRHPSSILNFPEAPEEQDQREHEMMYVFKEKGGTYNPQKTKIEGKKPYKDKRSHADPAGYYRKEGDKYTHQPQDNKGLFHPTTIVAFNNPKKSLHRTQKPVDLCEWLIKSYSNEGDLVLDFTMGSGTTGIACLNTGRRFIGIEKDADIFKLARNRLLKYEIEEMEFQ